MSDAPDIVARLSGMAADHGPDGWPAVKMREITALCDEVTRLRAELAEAQQLARDDFDLRAEQRDERDRLRAGLAQAAPAGWQLAPMTPDPGMLHAGWIGHDESLAARYRAMLAAVPNAQQAGAWREPLSDAQAHALLVGATIERTDMRSVYLRGLRDGERAHGIGTKGAARTEDAAPGEPPNGAINRRA